ncbi:MAG: hypothetical protein AB1921_18650 [Thermodesulfobacteriota bacterium]
MNKRLASGILALLLAALVAAPALAQTAPDSAAAKKFADAQVTIEQLRKQKDTDWKAILAQYEICAPVVAYTDKAFGTGYDKEIREKIALCAEGKDVRANQQYLAKGLQDVNVINMRSLLRQTAKDKNAPAVIAAFFEGVRPTFIRRDKDFYKGTPTLEKEALDALAGISAGGPAAMTAIRNFEDAVDRTYGLSVLYEVEEMEEIQATKPEECPVKVAEASVFYRIVKPRIAKKSPKDDAFIIQMLAGSCAAMNAAELEKALNAGLAPAKLR